MPIHETNTAGVLAQSVTNHWGYQTMSYFAPNRAYSSDRSRGGPTREFKAMVRAFHAAGIEVYLDVVFNHTAEGGHWDHDRSATGFTSLGGFAPLLAAIADFAADRHIEIIAEAWDLWGYEVGNFPAGWGEWNGRYRDAVRGFLKGDGNTAVFSEMMNGDYANFND